jgi:hypothetical protein
MPRATPRRVVNRLLARLPRQECSRILRACEQVDLAFDDILCEPHAPCAHVYFPLTATISLVAPVDGRPPLEMVLIGNEGMLGATLALGINAMPLRGAVQGTGAALRMTAARFQRQLRDNPALRRRVKRYLYVLLAQSSQTAACTRFHDIESRLARWLLETHDRAHGQPFQLTHQFLANMLGVRRSGITVAAGDLQRREVITYTRGTIEVLDRKRLETAACECYRAVLDSYARMLA